MCSLNKPRGSGNLEEGVEVTSELNTRFLCNDPEKPLSWAEWEALKKFYGDLEKATRVLGRDFYLVKKEVDRRLVKLNFIKEQMKAREKKREK